LIVDRPHGGRRIGQGGASGRIAALQLLTMAGFD
jgi:hypothetical protein